MFKNTHLWLPGYLARSRQRGFTGPAHVFFCFVDHFEPLWRGASVEQGLERVRAWRANYPKMAEQFHDADGRSPQHSFFYPSEEYRPELLDELAKLCQAGYGEVEVHLHHDNDTPDNLTRTIEEFKVKLRNHGLLANDASGKVRYGFIHGNWALDNSRRDGRWCGVNNELRVLRDTGCYADFTLPSAPSDTQTRKINSIYYATDDPLCPKSHDTGEDACVGKRPSGDLLIVQGPLALNWRERKWGLLPRIENADVAGYAPATSARIAKWVEQRIGVKGKPDWIFVKVHTHGCQERNFDTAWGQSAARMHQMLHVNFNQGRPFVLHYVTAREVCNLIHAAEQEIAGTPQILRDHGLFPPPIRLGGQPKASQQQP